MGQVGISIASVEGLRRHRHHQHRHRKPKTDTTNTDTDTTTNLPPSSSLPSAFQERPGCFFLCGSMETHRHGLCSIPYDGGDNHHPTLEAATSDASPAAPPPKRQRTEETDMAVPGAGWAKAARTNCCPHGTQYDFNDNVLPYGELGRHDATRTRNDNLSSQHAPVTCQTQELKRAPVPFKISHHHHHHHHHHRPTAPPPPQHRQRPNIALPHHGHPRPTTAPCHRPTTPRRSSTVISMFLKIANDRLAVKGDGGSSMAWALEDDGVVARCT